jgi:Tfp pilus assembly protein PilV
MGASVMNHFPRVQRREAFTLIEVMLAAAVMLAGIVGMIQVIASGSEMLDLARKQTIATQIIQNEIGKLHLADWSTVSGYTNADATLGTEITSNITNSSDSSYQNAATIFQNFKCYRFVSDVRTDLRKITFTVKWNTGNIGRSYSRSYSRTGSTYVSKNGLYVSYQRT